MLHSYLILLVVLIINLYFFPSSYLDLFFQLTLNRVIFCLGYSVILVPLCCSGLEIATQCFTGCKTSAVVLVVVDRAQFAQ